MHLVWKDILIPHLENAIKQWAALWSLRQHWRPLSSADLCSIILHCGLPQKLDPLLYFLATHLQACSNRRAKFKLATPTYVTVSLLYPVVAQLQPFLYFPHRLSASQFFWWLFQSWVQLLWGRKGNSWGKHHKDGHKKRPQLVIRGNLWVSIETVSRKLLYGNTCQALKQVDSIHCSVTP